MQVISRDQVVMVDVDGTLVSDKATGDYYYPIFISHPYRKNEQVKKIPMFANIQLLKDMHARGRFIVVWSAAGYAWAEAVVKALELESHVHLVMEKPIAYVDDLTANEFMGTRIFLE